MEEWMKKVMAAVIEQAVKDYQLRYIKITPDMTDDQKRRIASHNADKKDGQKFLSGWRLDTWAHFLEVSVPAIRKKLGVKHGKRF